MRSTSPRMTFTATFLVFCLLFSGLYANLASAQTVFTVEKVEVDVSAQNALAARELAFEQAQIEAFLRLVARLAPSEAATLTRETLDISLVAPMIKDYEVLSEKISDVRYIASYTFRFSSDLVKKYFSGQAITYTDIESDPVMILPFYQVNRRFDLWSYNNRWKQAWDRVKARRSLVPTVIPVGDLQDVNDMRDDQAMSYDAERLKALVERYGAREAVIAVAQPDSSLLQSMTTGALPEGALVVSLFRTDGATPIKAIEFYVSADAIEAGSYDAMFDAAVARVQKMLGDNWKAQTMVSGNQVNQIQLRIGLRSLEDWVHVQKSLKEINSTNDLTVNSLSADRAVVTLAFEGDLSRLQLSLRRKGMRLDNLQNYDVSTRANLPVYELVR